MPLQNIPMMTVERMIWTLKGIMELHSSIKVDGITVNLCKECLRKMPCPTLEPIISPPIDLGPQNGNLH